MSRQLRTFANPAQCSDYFVQPTTLRGVGVTATVEEAMKGTLPSFDQGIFGINVMPLGASEVRAYRSRYLE